MSLNESTIRTFMDSIEIVFTLPQNYEYKATQSSFPTTFSNGANYISGTNGGFEMVSLSDESVLFFSKETNTHISIDYFTIGGLRAYQTFIRSTDDVFQSSTGILIEGCPEDLVNTEDESAIYEVEVADGDIDCFFACYDVQNVAIIYTLEIFGFYDLCYADCTRKGTDTLNGYYNTAYSSLGMRCLDVDTISLDSRCKRSV